MNSSLNSNPPLVLIVGAGPVGLSLAIALSTFGIKPVIVDLKPGPTMDSKGLALGTNNLYCLEKFGIKSTDFESAEKVHRLNILWNKQRISCVDLNRLDGRIKHLITQPQKDTEQVMIDRLYSLGACVRWNTELVDFEQNEGFVNCKLSDSKGAIFNLRADWVIGCQGKNSSIREAMKCNFTGTDYPVSFALGDFSLSGPLKTGEVNYFVFKDIFIILIPLDKDHWRIVVRKDSNAEGDLEEFIRTNVSNLLGVDFEVGEATWVSQAPFYYRITDKLINDRLILAGDSAHLFSPIGGSGMNTGIQDALELSWRLYYSMRGYSKPSLLDQYEPIRLDEIKKAGLAADNLTKLICRIDQSPNSFSHLLPLFSNRKYLRSIPSAFSGVSRADSYFSSTNNTTLTKRTTGELFYNRQDIMDLIPSHQDIPPDHSILCLAAVKRLSNTTLESLSVLQASYTDIFRSFIFYEAKSEETKDVDFFRSSCVPVPSSDFDSLQIPEETLLLVYPNNVIGFSDSITSVIRLKKHMETYFNFSAPQEELTV